MSDEGEGEHEMHSSNGSFYKSEVDKDECENNSCI